MMPDMAAIEIRRALPADAEAVLALWRAADATASVTDTLADVRAIAGRPGAVFCLAIDVDGGGRVVGSLIGTFDGWRGQLYRLAVHPAHRRHGVARALVREVETALVASGARRINALVEKSRPDAAQFWKAVGYPLDEGMSRHVRDV